MPYSKLMGTTAMSGVNLRSLASSPASSSSTRVSLKPGGLDLKMGAVERGIVISNPLKISGTSVTIESGRIDPAALRRALLFWDKIVWPATSGIHFDGGPDVQFLESENQLIRPHFRVNGDAATALSLAFSETFKLLSKQHPGQWLLSEGERSLQVHGNIVESGRGLILKLTNAVPIPDREIPLEDLIRFRERRIDEVVALRALIEEFYQQWVISEDKDHQLALAISKIDSASADMVKVARESKLPFSMSSWKVNFSASPDAFKAVTGYLSAAQVMELGTVGGLMAGAASSMISFGTDIGLRSANGGTPFNYVATMESSLF